MIINNSFKMKRERREFKHCIGQRIPNCLNMSEIKKVNNTFKIYFQNKYC